MASAVFGQTTTTAMVKAAPTSIAFSYQIGAHQLPAAQIAFVRASSGIPAFSTSVADANTFWLTVSP